MSGNLDKLDPPDAPRPGIAPISILSASDTPTSGLPVAVHAITAAPRLEGYDIVRELGRGGQAVVYEALQRSTQRAVAIKVLVEGELASPTAQRRFEREVELVASLKHPNVVTVFDSGVTPQGLRFCVMDLVRGVPITQYLREHRLSIEQVLEALVAAADGVSHAHQRGVIHRDLKPSNMLVDDAGGVRILDFGLAKVTGETAHTAISTSGQLMGTLQYMSPEQTRANPDAVDVRTDVYALGVIAYECLTGEVPYPMTGDLQEILRHICTTPPAPMAQAWTKERGALARRAGRCPIGDEVQTIVFRALAKERERRYQSAAELAGDIRSYLAGRPIEARKDHSVYVLRKLLSRHPAPSVAAGLLLVFLLVSTIVFMALYGRAIRAEREARRSLEQSEKTKRIAEDAAAQHLSEAAKATKDLEVSRLREGQSSKRLRDGMLSAGDWLLEAGRADRARDSYLAAWKASAPEDDETPIIFGFLQACWRQANPPLVEHHFGGAAGSIAISPDRRMVAVAEKSGPRAVLIDAATSAILWEVSSTVAAQSIAWSADGTGIICIDAADAWEYRLPGRESARLANRPTTRPIARPTALELLIQKSTTAPVMTAASADGSLIISAEADGRLRFWDVLYAIHYRNLSEKVSTARQALAANPQDGDALASLGIWCAMHNQPEQSNELLLLARRQGRTVSSLLLAQNWRRMRKFPEAVKCYDDAINRSEASGLYMQLCREACGAGR